MPPKQRDVPQLQSLVKQECRHIPRDIRCSPQNVFRGLFALLRQRGCSRDDALQGALSVVRKRWPEVEFVYDRTFFVGN